MMLRPPVTIYARSCSSAAVFVDLPRGGVAASRRAQGAAIVASSLLLAASGSGVATTVTLERR